MTRLAEVELKAVFAGLELELLSSQAALGLLLQLNQQENKPRRSWTPEAPPALSPWRSQRERGRAHKRTFVPVCSVSRTELLCVDGSTRTLLRPQHGKPTNKVPGTTAATTSVQPARMFRVGGDGASRRSEQGGGGGLNLHQRQRRDQVLQVVPDNREDETVWDQVGCAGQGT